MLSLTPKLQYSLRDAVIFSRHLRKSIFAGNLYLRPFEIMERIHESEMIFRLPVMTRRRINIFIVLTVSGVRATSFDIKIRNNFIEIKYSAHNRFIIFITND